MAHASHLFRMFLLAAGFVLLTPAVQAATTTLTIARQPECSLSGGPISPHVVVHVLADGKLDTSYTGTITASRWAGTGTVSGTTSVQALGGVATFSDLRFNGSGWHSIRFKLATGQTADTSSFMLREVPYTTRGALLPEHQIIDSKHSIKTRYKVFVPSSNIVGTVPSAANPTPLIIYGHAAGQYGDPNTMIGGAFGQRVTGNPSNYPFFVVFPAIADTRTTLDKAGWMEALPEIVARLKADGYHIDTTRIYYYGYSTGGIHLMDLLVRHPNFWAAMVALDCTFTSAHMTDNGEGPPTGSLAADFFDPVGTDTAVFAEVARLAAESGTALSFHESAVSPLFVNSAGRNIRDLLPFFNLVDARVTQKFERSSGVFNTVPTTTNPRVYRLYTNLNHDSLQATIASTTNWPAMQTWFQAQRRSAASAPVVKTHPLNQWVLVGQTATFSVVAVGAPVPALQWQKSTNGGVTWTAIAGATAATYTTPLTALADHNTHFRCVATNAAASTLSTAAVLSVSAAPVLPSFTKQPLDLTVKVGQEGRFTAAAVGVPAPSLQWQKSTDGGANWSAIPGETRFTHSTPTTALADSGTRIRCVATNAAGSVSSNVAILTVTTQAPYFATQPGSRSVLVGQTATFSVEAYGAPLPTLQWQKSTDGGATWTAIPGATARIYTTPATVLADSGTRLRCAATNIAATVNSNIVTLTVQSGAPVFTTQPASKSVIAGQTATFSLVVSANPAATLQWQKSTDGGATWTAITGATATTYTTPATVLADNNTRFRCVATNSAGTATSNAATLTVAVATVPPSFTTQPANKSVTVGQTAQFSVAASGVPAPTLQWQKSTDGGATWTAIIGATAATYTTPATVLADNNTRFRCVATNSAGTATSSAATLTVAAANRVPKITSEPRATPSPAAPGDVVQLSVTAEDPDGNPLVYSWVFGDGASGSGHTAQHIYAVAGTYMAAITVSDGSLSVTAHVRVDVIATPADPALAAHWKLDETSGNVAEDATANQNKGELINNPAWVAARIGGGLKFNGSNTYVSCGNQASINPASQITLSAWMNSSKGGVSATEVIVAKDSPNGQQYYLRIQAGGKLRFCIAGTQLGGNTLIQPNRWYFIAATYDGVTMKIFIDGVLDASQPKTGQMVNNNSNLRIGNREGKNLLTFNGILDDIRIHNRALSADALRMLRGSVPQAAVAAPASAFMLKKFSATLNTRQAGKDTCAIHAIIPDVDSVAAAALAIGLNGREETRFMLDLNGRARTEAGSAALRLSSNMRTGERTAALTLKLTNGAWTNVAKTLATSGEALELPISLQIGDRLLQASVPLLIKQSGGRVKFVRQN